MNGSAMCMLLSCGAADAKEKPVPKIVQPLIVTAAFALLAACSSPQPAPPPASMAPPPGPMAAPAPPPEEPYVAPSTGPRKHYAVHHRKGKKVVHHRRHY